MAALSEEQPVLAGGRERTPLMEKSAEGSDAGTRADHHDGRISRSGQTEFLVWLNVDGPAVTGGSAIGEQRGADAATFTVVRTIANHGDSSVDFPGVCVGARGDRVEARRKFG